MTRIRSPYASNAPWNLRSSPSRIVDPMGGPRVPKKASGKKKLLEVAQWVIQRHTHLIWSNYFGSHTRHNDKGCRVLDWSSDMRVSNYSDLTRPHPKRWFSKGNPLISGKSGLVKYYNLARSIFKSTFSTAFRTIITSGKRFTRPETNLPPIIMLQWQMGVSPIWVSFHWGWFSTSMIMGEWVT